MRSPMVIDVSGGPYDRGRIHGEQARALVHDGLAAWREALGAQRGDVDAYLARFLAETNFVEAIERYTPDLLDEVYGIADGAGVDRQTMYAYQLMDEEWCFAQRERAGSAPGHHCTTVGIAVAGSRPLVGMNLDLPEHVDGTQVVLRIHGRDERQGLVLAVAGIVAHMGCNEAGVAVVVNALGDVPSAADGLPVAFVIRCVLEQESPAAARSFLERVPHASGQNYLVGDPGGIFDLECSADGVCEHAPGAVIVHTNHALVSAPGNRRAVAPTASSRDRFDWVTAALGASGPESITWQDVGRALADRTVPVFRVPTAADPWITFGSIVMELGRPPTFRLAVDHSGETAYQEIGFATQARPEC